MFTVYMKKLCGDRKPGFPRWMEKGLKECGEETNLGILSWLVDGTGMRLFLCLDGWGWCGLNLPLSRKEGSQTF